MKPNIHNLVTKSDHLELLKRAIQYRQRYKDLIIVELQLPAESCDGFHVADKSKQTLIVHSSNPGISSKIRLMQQQIILAINKHSESSQSIEKIKVLTRPNFKKRLSKRAQLRQISASSAELLRNTAECIEEPELAKALLKLCRHQEGL